jgi:hypothetical protein
MIPETIIEVVALILGIPCALAAVATLWIILSECRWDFSLQSKLKTLINRLILTLIGYDQRPTSSRSLYTCTGAASCRHRSRLLQPPRGTLSDKPGGAETRNVDLGRGTRASPPGLIGLSQTPRLYKNPPFNGSIPLCVLGHHVGFLYSANTSSDFV